MTGGGILLRRAVLGGKLSLPRRKTGRNGPPAGLGSVPFCQYALNRWLLNPPYESRNPVHLTGGGSDNPSGGIAKSTACEGAVSPDARRSLSGLLRRFAGFSPGKRWNTKRNSWDKARVPRKGRARPRKRRRLGRA